MGGTHCRPIAVGGQPSDGLFEKRNVPHVSKYNNIEICLSFTILIRIFILKALFIYFLSFQIIQQISDKQATPTSALRR